MKRSRFSEEQIIAVFKEQEARYTGTDDGASGAEPALEPGLCV